MELASKETIDQIEKKLRTQVQLELMGIQSRIFGKGDIIILSSLGIDGARKLAEILVEEAQLNLKKMNTEV